MIRFENTVEINRPIEEVFPFIADFENLPRWNYYVLNVRQISDGLPGAGTIYHQVRKDDTQDFEIVDFQPYHKIAVRTTAGSTPAFERVFTFEATPAGTRLIDGWELETGLNQLVERLGAGKIKAAVAENLGKLKQLLERGETRLQDGRISHL
jgi:uncharacterized protein YndB with AHSA1/START domain